MLRSLCSTTKSNQHEEGHSVCLNLFCKFSKTSRNSRDFYQNTGLSYHIGKLTGRCLSLGKNNALLMPYRVIMSLVDTQEWMTETQPLRTANTPVNSYNDVQFYENGLLATPICKLHEWRNGNGTSRIWMKATAGCYQKKFSERSRSMLSVRKTQKPITADRPVALINLRYFVC
jgi:hypothetical protein